MGCRVLREPCNWSISEYGMVWYVWYPTVVMVCYGMIWNATLRYEIVCYGMLICGIVWYATLRYGTVWYSTVWYGMIRYGAVQYGIPCTASWVGPWPEYPIKVEASFYVQEPSALSTPLVLGPINADFRGKAPPACAWNTAILVGVLNPI